MDLIDIFIYDTTINYLFLITIRCLVMFIMIIVVLRFTGKRGVRQLSIFELAIILCLGSAAGDPMFIKDAPLIQAIVVLFTILLLYRCTTWIAMKSKKVEYFLEGQPIYIVSDGMLIVQDISKEKYSHDEFFSEMRQKNITHLGQIECALLETSGCVSIIYFEGKNIKWGLPIYPHSYQKATKLSIEQYYSCMYCGFTSKLSDINQICSHCKNSKHDWAKSSNSHRCD